MRVITRLFLLPVLLLLVQCSAKKFQKDYTFAGGKYVSADHLNLGYRIYTNYCGACHGPNGDGKGAASKGLFPPPRNFTLGIYKFSKSLAGELPDDETFAEIITKGLHGTAMLPWAIQGEALDSVIQYIKTFAPKVWEDPKKEIGKRVSIGSDPFTAAKASAIELGKKVYHVKANCQMCHRAYELKKDISAWNKEINGEEISEFEANLYELKPQSFEDAGKAIPLDFTYHIVRSAKTIDELAHRIAAGVGGAAMPSWKDTITDEEIWSLAYYVRHLMDIGQKPKERDNLMSILEKQ